MIGDFDKAFLNKIQKVWPNTIYANTEITYHAIYSGGASPIEGKLKLPLINIYRADGYELLPLQTLAGRLQGYTHYTKKDGEKELIFQSRFLLARVGYQLNIFAKTLAELDSITNDIITMFNLNPKLEVTQWSKNKKVNHKEEYEITYLRGPVEQSTFNDDDRVYTYAIGYEISVAKLVNFKQIYPVESIEIAVTLDDIIGPDNITISSDNNDQEEIEPDTSENEN